MLGPQTMSTFWTISAFRTCSLALKNARTMLWKNPVSVSQVQFIFRTCSLVLKNTRTMFGIPCLSVSSSGYIPYMFVSVEERSHDALEYILKSQLVSKGIMTNADMFGRAIQNYRQLTRLSILSMPTSSLEVQHSWRNSV